VSAPEPAQYAETVLTAEDWERAVRYAAQHYPESVFPPNGTSTDCASARFARALLQGICDRAQQYAAERQGTQFDGSPDA
jgi:hypothetical protein